VGRLGTTSLALVGFAVVVAPAMYQAYEDYNDNNDNDNNDFADGGVGGHVLTTKRKKTKPGVLVIPFHRLKLVETTQGTGVNINPADIISSTNKDTAPITVRTVR
jgi:hypothetical protein